MIEKAATTRLTGFAAFSAAAGDRLFPVQAPQDTALPYVVYHLISDSPVNNSLGASTTNRSRIQFDSVGVSYAQARELDAIVRDAFKTWHDDTGSHGVTGIRAHIEDGRSDEMNQTPGSQTGRYRITRDVILWHAL